MDLVLEAVPEDLELKRRVFVQVDKVVRSEAIFASNTSGFAISHLNQASGRKDRFLGMHWFSPAPVMRLVELIYVPETSEETLETVERLCERLGKMSVRIKDAPGSYGFVANRIYFAAVRPKRRRCWKLASLPVRTSTRPWCMATIGLLVPWRWRSSLARDGHDVWWFDWESRRL